MFKVAATDNNHTDRQVYTETVTAYIKKCIDDVTVTKTITTRANQKPWMTAKVRGLLKTRNEAVRSGDKAATKKARANLPHGIKKAKHQYAKKKKSTKTSATVKNLGPCGKPFRPSLTTILHHRPVTMTHPYQMHSTTSTHDLRNKTTHLPRNYLHLQTTRCLSPADVRKTLTRINRTETVLQS